MNPEALQELKRILTIEPEALSDAEKAFLKARRSYLSKSEEIDYASVLDEAEETKDGPSFAELKARYTELTGNKVKVGTKREELITLIAEAETQ